MVLESDSSTTMFKCRNEAQHEPYSKGSKDNEYLVAGKNRIAFIRHGTLKVDSVKLTNSVHVKNLNKTLISVGHICDT